MDAAAVELPRARFAPPDLMRFMLPVRRTLNVIVFWFVNTYRSPLVEVIELVASAACRMIA